MDTPATIVHNLGQRLWLDSISRELLDSGWLLRYIGELHVTGLTSNPSIFEQAIGAGQLYDLAIRDLFARGLTGAALFFELALQDLRRAADLFRPMFEASHGLDGWVSLEVSPLLGDDTAGTVQSVAQLHAQGARPNLFIKIPGTPQGLGAIEQSIADGVPVNVTLLFSSDQYLAAAHAYLRGLERRLAAGQNLRVGSVASLFISRWDHAVQDQVPPDMHNRLGIAVARQAYRMHNELLACDRWQHLAAAGAQPQRLLWASMGTKDPKAPDTLYLDALVAARTISTVPEKTLLSFTDHGKPGVVMPHDGGDAEAVLQDFRDAGINLDLLAARLQREGMEAFSKSWNALMSRLREKTMGPAAA